MLHRGCRAQFQLQLQCGTWSVTVTVTVTTWYFVSYSILAHRSPRPSLGPNYNITTSVASHGHQACCTDTPYRGAQNRPLWKHNTDCAYVYLIISWRASALLLFVAAGDIVLCALQVRELVNDFYGSRYASCLNHLTRLRPMLELDIHAHTHLTTLYELVSLAQ